MSFLFHRVIVFTIVLNRCLWGPDPVPHTMLGSEGAAWLPQKPGPGKVQVSEGAKKLS